jgi:HSP20 family molecular chaperone IbpA
MIFDDIFKEFREIEKKMTERMFNDFEDFEKAFESGEIKGNWQVEPIERPGLRGFVARGYFSTTEPFERPKDLLPPLKPSPKEPRKPFYDINEKEDTLELYIELPGVEEEEIEIKADKENFHVKAGAFELKIDISKWILDTENFSKEYKNGVLKASLPVIRPKEHLI